jgi:hypothetical protein
MKVRGSSSAGSVASLGGSGKNAEKASLLATMNDPGAIDKTEDEKQGDLQEVMKSMVQNKFM